MIVNCIQNLIIIPKTNLITRKGHAVMKEAKCIQKDNVVIRNKIGMI
jgi:hypothetical protein